MALAKVTTVITFPAPTFLEQICSRGNNSLLISNLLDHSVCLITDPEALNPEIITLHQFDQGTMNITEGEPE
jgi:hypothetical protein